ncbi:hypothetical protein PLICRDRAFT_227312 [Plicaturopsis crispa FD-325 SS-3]|nr:hypothetical protein PLICRDRAFT_227312 [Plicaturopsis crispa FD-325 SS-3]
MNVNPCLGRRAPRPSKRGTVQLTGAGDSVTWAATRRGFTDGPDATMKYELSDSPMLQALFVVGIVLGVLVYDKRIDVRQDSESESTIAKANVP